MNDTTQLAALHDGSELAATALGNGAAVLLPVRIEPYDDATAETMRKWGAEPGLGRNTTVEIAPPLATSRDRLIAAGWNVELLPGLDHTGAMRSEHVLPLLQPWPLEHRP
jgi:hypothetical protein